MRGEAANVIGLLSNVAHWKQFDEMRRRQCRRLPHALADRRRRPAGGRPERAARRRHRLWREQGLAEHATSRSMRPRCSLRPSRCRSSSTTPARSRPTPRSIPPGIDSPAAKADHGLAGDLGRADDPCQRHGAGARRMASPEPARCSTARPPSTQAAARWTRCRPQARRSRSIGRGERSALPTRKRAGRWRATSLPQTGRGDPVPWRNRSRRAEARRACCSCCRRSLLVAGVPHLPAVLGLRLSLTNATGIGPGDFVGARQLPARSPPIRPSATASRTRWC